MNFSKIARETPIVAQIKTTLNIILSGILALNILRYIYNLILTTLGIENPFVIENEKEKIKTKENNKNTDKKGASK